MRERMDQWMRTLAVAIGPMLKQEVRNGKCRQEHGPPGPNHSRKFAKSIRQEIELEHQPVEEKHRDPSFQRALSSRNTSVQTPNFELQQTLEH